MAQLLKVVLVCALAQSQALVVSAHTGALIRSGVSTPTQQLCRWAPPPVPRPGQCCAGSAAPAWATASCRAASAARIKFHLSELSASPCAVRRLLRRALRRL